MNKLLCLLILLIFFSCSVFAGDFFYDPTEPTPLCMNVTAIYISPQKKVAMINGIRYGEKDRLGGWVIEAILHHQVIMDNQGEKMTLYLTRSFAKDGT